MSLIYNGLYMTWKNKNFVREETNPMTNRQLPTTNYPIELNQPEHNGPLSPIA
jgi:hypothetical protein